MIQTRIQPLFLPSTGDLFNIRYMKVAHSSNFFFFILVLAGLGISCNKKATEPAYLHVEPFKVITNAISEGTSVQYIPEMILIVDDQPAGVYHLPADIPLLYSGTHNVRIAPAIIENAIGSNPRYAYTYFAPFDTALTFTPSGSISVTPRISYRKNVKFALLEDFENPNLLLIKTTFNNLDTLLRDSLPADNLEPGHCGFATLNDKVTMEYATRISYALPSSSSSNTFLEVSYKTELPLAFGIYTFEPGLTTTDKIPVVTLNEKDGWSKAYINLTNDVSAKSTGTVFKLFVAAQNTTGAPKKVFIDNIKILYFE